MGGLVDKLKANTTKDKRTITNVNRAPDRFSGVNVVTNITQQKSTTWRKHRLSQISWN